MSKLNVNTKLMEKSDFDYKCYQNEPIETIYEISEFIEEYGGLGVKLLNDFNNRPKAALHYINNNYVGKYPSKLEFAKKIFKEWVGIKVEPAMERYTDYSKFSDDIFDQEFYMVTINNETHIFNK